MRDLEIQKYRQALADHFDLQLHIDQDGTGFMYGDGVWSDLYNFLASLHKENTIVPEIKTPLKYCPDYDGEGGEANV